MPQQSFPSEGQQQNIDAYIHEDFFGESDTESENDLEMDPNCTDETIETYAAQLLPDDIPTTRANIVTALYETYQNIKKRYRTDDSLASQSAPRRTSTTRPTMCSSKKSRAKAKDEISTTRRRVGRPPSEARQ